MLKDRLFAIVDISNVTGSVNRIGESVIDTARHSLDGTQIIIDFNHPRETIDGLFIAGTNVDGVIAGCLILDHREALDLMDTTDWSVPEEEGVPLDG